MAALLMVVAVTDSGRAGAADDADPIRELDTLVGSADFDAAETKAKTLFHSGSLTRPQAARVYLALGVVSAARRDPGKAELAFRRALMLDADLTLPSGLGPHVAASFDRARAALASSPPASPQVTLAAQPGTSQFRIKAEGPKSDDALARSFVVKVADFREEHDLGKEPTELVLSLPPSVARCATASVGLLDEHGNELWPAVATAEVCRLIPAAPTATVGAKGASLAPAISDGKSAPSRRAVWVAGAATGALAVATGMLGWVAVERRDAYHHNLDSPTTFGEEQRLMEEASTAQRRATIGAIAVGLAATTTLILYLASRR